MGKYIGVDNSYISQLKGQGGTPMSSKLIYNSENSDWGEDVTLFDAVNINWSGYKIGESYITYTGDLIEMLNTGDIAGGSSYIPGSNSITVGGTKYSIAINPDGNGNFVIDFSSFTAATLSGSCSPSSYSKELDVVSSAGYTCSLTFTGTIHNFASGISYWWESETHETATSSTSIYSTQYKVMNNTSGSYTKTFHILQEGNSQVNESISFNYNTTKKRYFLGWSTRDNLTFSNSNNSHNILSTPYYNNFSNDLSASFYGTPYTCSESGYWYLIIPESKDISKIYFGAGSAKAPAQGGWTKHSQETVTQYSTGVVYHIYRSINPFSVAMNIQF